MNARDQRRPMDDADFLLGLEKTTSQNASCGEFSRFYGFAKKLTESLKIRFCNSDEFSPDISTHLGCMEQSMQLFLIVPPAYLRKPFPVKLSESATYCQALPHP